MISTKQDTQRRMLSSKQLPKNPKLASMTNIASRSPLNKFQNKQSPTANTLPSKKPLFQNKQRTSAKLTTNTSPRNSTTVEAENGMKRTFSKPSENTVKNLIPQRNDNSIKNMFPEWSPQQGNLPPPQKPDLIIKNLQPGQKIQATKSITLVNGDKYEGQFVNNMFQGKGIYLFLGQNLKYEGEFMQGRQHGFGTLIDMVSKQTIYEGNWQFGMKHGEGRFTYDQDQYYNGDWVNDQKHGLGVYHYAGGFYNGSWVKGKREGKGSLKLQNGTEFKGSFEGNQFVKGFVRYPNGDQYSGELKNNRRTGQQGSYIQAATKTRYKGAWFNDKKNGKGAITYENGDQLTGTFKDGDLNEQYDVKYQWRDGSVFTGWFRNNQPNKGTVSRANGQKWQI